MASLKPDPLPAGSFGMVSILGPVAHPPVFCAHSPKYRCGNLRVTGILEFCALANAETCPTLVAANITVSWEQWVSHSVTPEPEIERMIEPDDGMEATKPAGATYNRRGEDLVVVLVKPGRSKLDQ